MACTGSERVGPRHHRGTAVEHYAGIDVELSIRGILRGFGLKVGEVSKGRFAARVEELVAGHEMLEEVIGAMLRAREGLRAEFARLHRRMLTIVRGDTVCRRLMTAPGV